MRTGSTGHPRIGIVRYARAIVLMGAGSTCQRRIRSAVNGVRNALASARVRSRATRQTGCRVVVVAAASRRECDKSGNNDHR